MFRQLREDFFRKVGHSLLQYNFYLLLGHEGGFGLFAVT